MARLQLIVPLLFWVMWLGSRDATLLFTPEWGTAVYFSVLGCVVGCAALWSRRVMRHTTVQVTSAVSRFHQGIVFARWLVLLLHLAALFTLGYGDLVMALIPTAGGRTESLAAFFSILPVVIAWIGLMWAQYPLDRAIREQNALYAFEFGEPVHPVPTLRQYLLTGIRQQILFTLAPLAVAGLLRDGLHATFQSMGFTQGQNLDLILSLVAVGIVFTIAPEVLRRVLPTEPLPPSPLRDRLETMCRELNLKYREILIWHTHHTLANAAVMGLVPQVRYILLSDRLIETMTEDQIAAVFAHEAGHVVYRHLAWFGVFMAVFSFAASGGDMITEWSVNYFRISVALAQWAEMIIGVILFFGAFGALSRAFERQADVFAARCLIDPSPDAPLRPEGVEIFSSALSDVARLNNMPMDARPMMRGRGFIGRWYAMAVHHAGTWLHGSIRSRIDYLQHLPDRPERSERFDQRMYVIRVALLVALCSCTAWALTTLR